MWCSELAAQESGDDADVVIRPLRDEARGMTTWLLSRTGAPRGMTIAKLRVRRTHCLHGYHGTAPPIGLIALFAPIARSTKRSTAKHLPPPVPLLCVTWPGALSPRPRANSQTPPRGTARFILLLDVRGGGLG